MTMPQALPTVETKNLQKQNPRRSGKTAGVMQERWHEVKARVSRCRAKDPPIDRSADAKSWQGDLVSKPHSISALMCWNKKSVKLRVRLQRSSCRSAGGDGQSLSELAELTARS